MAIVTDADLIQVETEDLAPAALASPGSGNSLYSAYPGDGTWKAAPDHAAKQLVTPPFTTSSFTAKVQTAAIELEISSDGGANFGDKIVLEPGSHAFDLDATDFRVCEDVDAGGAEFQIVSFA